MGNAITFRMLNGFAGQLSRFGVGEIVEQGVLGATPPSAYGQVVKVSGNSLILPSGSGDSIYGFLVRPFPTEDFTSETGAPNNQQGYTSSLPPSQYGLVNVMTSGYILTKVGTGGGTPGWNGTVYFRYANATANLPIGGLEATSVGGSNAALSNARWMGAPDSNGVAEIFFENP